MNILVTGGAGYIGSVVVNVLLRNGHFPIIIDNFQEGNFWSVPKEAKFYYGNIGNERLLDKVFTACKIDTVLHFAAETTIKFSMTDPKIYFENNVVNGITLLNAMLKNNCNKFIFSSTAAVFGEPKYVPIDEDHPKIPINSYGESKLMFEQILEWYHKAYGLKYNTFRYFNAAGAITNIGESHKHESHLIPVLIQSVLNNELVYLFGNDYQTKDGTCIRDYIHVEDLAYAHIFALNNLDKHPNGKYNLGNGSGFSNLEVLRTIEKVSGKTVNFKFAERRIGDPAILIASSNLAKQELGWNPKYTTLESIIRTAWVWHYIHQKQGTSLYE